MNYKSYIWFFLLCSSLKGKILQKKWEINLKTGKFLVVFRFLIPKEREKKEERSGILKESNGVDFKIFRKGQGNFNQILSCGNLF